MSTAGILIVEDERITAMEVQAMREEMDYEVTGTVNSGFAALEILEEESVDLVIMDIRLNGELDGVETTRKINDRFEDLPVIYFSAYSDDRTLEDARETEPAGFLIKPITKEDLLLPSQWLWVRRNPPQVRRSNFTERSVSGRFFLTGLSSRCRSASVKTNI